MEDLASGFREKADMLRENDYPAGATVLYRKAADMGDAGAASSLGYMLMVGEGIPVDREGSEHYLRMAAESGDTAAMCNLGVLLSDPEWFSRASDLGSIRGTKNLAAAYAMGSGVGMDKVRAAQLYQRAADMGDVDSMCVLASMLRNGDGIPVDKMGAAGYYRKAADMGDRDAQYDLAFMLDSGEGIPQDRMEAERLFRLSAEQGDTDACLCLGGILYERGEYREAERWFLEAALKGDVKASYNLGLMYADGSLGEPDHIKATEWFESAASEGFAYAQTMMGTLSLDSGDNERAEVWFRKAAAQGEPTAMYNLGALGISGQIAMGDREAMDWLVRAATAGMPQAAELISRLTSG